MRSASRLLLIGRSVWLCLTAVLALAVASTPAVSAPVVAGFSVTVYATATDPMNMSFALDGALHIGRDNIGSGGDFGDAVKVSKIAAGGGTAQEFGESSIADPDSVLVDRHGLISGTIGSVLVGGGAGLYAINPDGSVHTVYTAAKVRGDIDDMQFDSTGRLLMISGQDQIKYSTGGDLEVLMSVSTSTPVSMAIDGANRIFLAGISGTVSIYDALGTLIQADFLTGLGPNPRIRFGGGGAFGTDLYVMDNAGDLLSVAADGTKTLFGSGFGAGTVMTAGSWIAFGPDGALYVAEFPNDRVLRIAALVSVPEPATLALVGAALIGMVTTRRRRPAAPSA